MAEETRNDLRNLAILAHVDHGKTTLVDALLWQAALLREHPDLPDERLSEPEPAREKAVRVMPRTVSLEYRGVTIQLLDTPGRADFGGEVRRTLRMADGILYVVDAREGPSPRNRFVLAQALADGLEPVVVLTKMDQPGTAAEAVVDQIREIFLDLDACREQLEFPVLYCDAFRGVGSTDPAVREGSMRPLLDTILETIPGPEIHSEAPFLMQVTDLDYDDYHGRLAVGRILQGRIQAGEVLFRRNGAEEPTRGTVSGICRTQGMAFREFSEATAGDVAALAGLEGVKIGDTLSTDPLPEPLPALPVDRPTISVVIEANDSPTAGQDGRYIAAADLRERLWREILTNPGIHVEEIAGGNSFRIRGRDELQLAILIEMMRREGYEMLVSHPEVVTAPSEDGTGTLEPIETLVIDCPEPYAAVVIQKAEARQGKMIRMVNHGTGRTRVEFRIPARGLIGFRSEFLSDTRGAGIMNHIFLEYGAACREEPPVRPGVMVADRPGRATAWAIEHLQSRGPMFVSPGDEVYEGMIVGENSTGQDVRVDITKIRKKGSAGAEDPGEERARLIPPRFLSLEQAMEYLSRDSVVEVTPRLFRLRKRTLKVGQATENP